MMLQVLGGGVNKILHEFSRLPESSVTLKVKIRFSSVKYNVMYACQLGELVFRI